MDVKQLEDKLKLLEQNAAAFLQQHLITQGRVEELKSLIEESKAVAQAVVQAADVVEQVI